MQNGAFANEEYAIYNNDVIIENIRIFKNKTKWLINWCIIAWQQTNQYQKAAKVGKRWLV